MSGRHAFSAASNALSDSKVRTAAAALAAGAMLGTAFPVVATINESSGAQALADFTVSKDEAVAAKNPVIADSGTDDLVVGQVAVEDSVVADNVDLALEVNLPVASTTSDTASTQVSTPAQQSVAKVAAPLSAEEAGSIVGFARQFAGTPYVYGGTTPAGFDCSGFVQYVYAQFGVSLPRTAAAQGAAGQVVSAAEAQPGDIVVWGGYHVGIYTGNGYHIAAHMPGTPLSETPLYGSYYFVRIAH